MRYVFIEPGQKYYVQHRDGRWARLLQCYDGWGSPRVKVEHRREVFSIWPADSIVARVRVRK